MDLKKMFSGDTAVLGLRAEAEIQFAQGNPDNVVAVDRIPAVHEATTAVLKARGAAATATAEAAKFPAGQITLAAATAAGNLEGAHKTLRAAEERLREVLEGEWQRIVVERLAGRRAKIARVDALLEEAAAAHDDWMLYDQETERLSGRSVSNQPVYFNSLIRETPTLQGSLESWRRRLRTDGLL